METTTRTFLLRPGRLHHRNSGGTRRSGRSDGGRSRKDRYGTGSLEGMVVGKARARRAAGAAARADQGREADTVMHRLPAPFRPLPHVVQQDGQGDQRRADAEEEDDGEGHGGSRSGGFEIVTGSGQSRALENHLFDGHEPASEVPHRLHLVDGDASRLPLRYSRVGVPEVRSECAGPARGCLVVDPVGEFHPCSLGPTKPMGQASAKPVLFRIPYMQDAQRRERFVVWFVQKYGRDDAEARARFMKATGLSKGRVSQLFDVGQPFGERAAQSLAEKLKLPSNSFLVGGSPTEPDTSRQGKPPHRFRGADIAALFDKLPLTEQDRFLRVLMLIKDGLPTLGNLIARDAAWLSLTLEQRSGVGVVSDQATGGKATSRRLT